MIDYIFYIPLNTEYNFFPPGIISVGEGGFSFTECETLSFSLGMILVNPFFIISDISTKESFGYKSTL